MVTSKITVHSHHNRNNNNEKVSNIAKITKMRQRYKVSRGCWKNGAYRSAWYTVATRLQSVENTVSAKCNKVRSAPQKRPWNLCSPLEIWDYAWEVVTSYASDSTTIDFNVIWKHLLPCFFLSLTSGLVMWFSLASEIWVEMTCELSGQKLKSYWGFPCSLFLMCSNLSHQSWFPFSSPAPRTISDTP